VLRWAPEGLPFLRQRFDMANCNDLTEQARLKRTVTRLALNLVTGNDAFLSVVRTFIVANFGAHGPTPVSVRKS
jgi:hypothetical protein